LKGGIKMAKEKYRGTTYDVYVKCPRGKTSITLMDKSVDGVKRQAKRIYKKDCKITKVVPINKVYR